MRFVIDVPPAVARAIATLIETGRFASVDDLAACAFHHFLNAEHPTDAGLGGRGPGSPPVAAPDRPEATRSSGQALGLLVVDTREPAPWIWGMVNRVFPLKLVTRVCADLCRDGPVSVNTLQARAVDLAVEIGRLLEADDERVGRRRNEARAVGFPLRKPLQRAKFRFAMHFVGRLVSDGRYVGGAFETGLIGPRHPGEDVVAPTETGWRFAHLQNPVLDKATAARNLSDEEAEFYLRDVVPRVNAERNAFRVILDRLEKQPLSPDQLADRTDVTVVPGLAASVVRTARAGALGRLIDLRAVARNVRGRSALLSITDAGRAALIHLRSSTGLRDD